MGRKVWRENKLFLKNNIKLKLINTSW
jgi:hypothetical protein